MFSLGYQSLALIYVPTNVEFTIGVNLGMSLSASTSSFREFAETANLTLSLSNIAVTSLLENWPQEDPKSSIWTFESSI